MIPLVVADQFRISAPTQQRTEEGTQFFVRQRNLQFTQQFLFLEYWVFLHANQAREQLEDFQFEQSFANQPPLIVGAGVDDLASECSHVHLLSRRLDESEQLGGCHDGNDSDKFFSEPFRQLEDIAIVLTQQREQAEDFAGSDVGQ